MTSLISGPSPSNQPIPSPVFTPVAPPLPAVSSAPPSEENSEPENTGGGISTEQAQLQEAGIIPPRGRQSTIRTGFRGILDEKNNGPSRKTLLGE